MQANFAGFTFTGESTMEQQFGGSRTHHENDRMEEDDKDDINWDKPAGRGDRMSGVIPSNNEHDIFNHGQMDV